jgi:hypothetical protein
MYKGNVLLLLFAACLSVSVQAQQLISDKPQANNFAIVTANNAAIICVDIQDAALVQKSAGWLQQDIEMVTGKKPLLSNSLPPVAKTIIIIGTAERSALVKQLVQEKKIAIDKLKNKWEAYLIQTIANPFKGIEQAIVIVGSGRRGAAYGVAELSQQIGVSPWYWWADVPVKKKKELYIKKNFTSTDAPLVKYRGIFINDEAPALSGWSKEKFGGFNHLFYE